MAAEAAPAPPEADSRPAIEGPERRAERPRRRVASALIFAGVLALVGYVVFSGVQRLLDSNSVGTRIERTEAEIDELEREAGQLRALIAWVGSDAYIERIAREDLGMVRPGEQAFAVHSPERPGVEIRRSPWWINLLPEESQPPSGEPAGD